MTGPFLDAFVIYALAKSGQFIVTFIGYLPYATVCVKKTSAIVELLEELASKNGDRSELQEMREELLSKADTIRDIADTYFSPEEDGKFTLVPPIKMKKKMMLETLAKEEFGLDADEVDAHLEKTVIESKLVIKAFDAEAGVWVINAPIRAEELCHLYSSVLILIAKQVLISDPELVVLS
ncbi:MAG: hypothetical protein LBV23_05990 [Deltaproteobacteria bacterium]|jgi:hypothetical protein|nr:hypothetical protein [Deltaproteobacteria bacterium]